MRSPSGLLLLAPLAIEAAAVRAGARNSLVERTGMGPRKAEHAAIRWRREMSASPPVDGMRAVAVAGVAGGLTGELCPGTAVVPDVVLDESGQVVAEIPASTMVAELVSREGLKVEVAPVLTSNRVVSGRSERSKLAGLGAAVVDMETSALAAEPWGVPFAVVRIVLDTPDDELISLPTIKRTPLVLRSLQSAARAVEAWAGLVCSRTVVLSEPRSYCAGVRRAISTVERALDIFGPPVYVRRQIVHNSHVVAQLSERGAIFVSELEEAPDGATVVFSAHGVAPAVRAEAGDRRMQAVDATCPLVAKVHSEGKRFREKGYEVVLIGDRGHDETVGTMGEIPGIRLLENPGEVESLPDVADGKVAFVTQTTLSQDEVKERVKALKRRFPEATGPKSSDICYASTNRQEAVRLLAARCDLIVVVGSANSSNTGRLVDVASRSGCRAVRVEDENDLRPAWFRDIRTVGVTAGASAPEFLVQRVLEALRGLGQVRLEQVSSAKETAKFSLPKEVR